MSLSVSSNIRIPRSIFHARLPGKLADFVFSSLILFHPAPSLLAGIMGLGGILLGGQAIITTLF